MADLWRTGPWGFRLLFVALACVFLFLRLLPLGREAGAFPGPDLLLCIMLAWVMRRPDYLPVWLIAGVALLEDMLLMRPPGLWAALTVVATEFLRGRVALARELSLLVEWLLAAVLMLAMLLLGRLVLALALMPLPPFGFAISQILWSILAYPLVAFLSRLLFDLRKPATGEMDDYGRRT